MKTKTLITAILLITGNLFAQTTTRIEINVQDLNNVIVNMPDMTLFQPVGKVDEAIKRYPALEPAIKAALESSLDKASEPQAARRMADLSAMGVTLSKPVVDKQKKRIQAFADAKEKALLAVKDKDPQRAKMKLDEYLANNVPIDKATQDAVMKALPTPPPAPTPTPTPSDGLD